MPRSRRPSASRVPLLAGALAFAGAAALAADPLANRDCADGVCMANIDAAHAVEPCRNANLVVAWAQAGGAMAIQCWTDDAPMDQPILVFDRRTPHGPVYEMAGVRPFVPEALPQIANPHREDNDAMLLACQPPRPPRMAPGELLLTEKVPSPWHTERNPYCWRVLRVATTPAGIAIRADDGDSPRPRKEAPEWSALAAKMSALAAQVDAQARARVTRARAPLRDAPDAKAPAHGWLVKGDAVVVLERRPAAGLAKVLYTGRDGKAIVRWITQADIAPDAAR